MRPIPQFRILMVAFTSLLAMACLSTSPAVVAEALRFDYANQKDWIAIHGDRQSPIALDKKTATPDDEDDEDDSLKLRGQIRDAVVVDNSHTIQVNVLPGNFAVIRGRRFQLQQFHFHSPSEHTLDGKRYPLEAHFVYKAKDGRLAVIGVMFEEGAANSGFDVIMRRVVRKGQSEPINDFDISRLLPIDKSYYRYLGSLTTPPLSQNVEWSVLARPMSLSRVQIADFHRYYTDNSRALQKRNDREVLYYRSDRDDPHVDH